MRTADINLARGISFTIALHEVGDSAVSDGMAEQKSWEPSETEIISRLVSGSCELDFFDIGANIGWYSLLVGKILGRRGRIHSFEPAPENASRLAWSASMNGLNNISVNPYGLGKETGTTRIFMSETNQGDHHLYETRELRRSQQVGLLRFDDYFDRRTDKPIVIKMDTQGFEYDIIQGMGDILRSHPYDIAMIVEFWPHGLIGNKADIWKFIALLEQGGFSPFVLSRGVGELMHPTTWESLYLASASSLAPITEEFCDLVLYRTGGYFQGRVADAT